MRRATFTTFALGAFAFISLISDRVFLPFITAPEPALVPEVVEEFRGLWVTRFDWTVFEQPADPAKIDEIVGNASLAGFNVIFFQVRGTADAYYTPGLEPWAQRVSGNNFGDPPDPLWDPLAYFVDKAHEAGIELHAYVNVYPTWDCGSEPDPAVLPQPLYYQLQGQYGETDGFNNGLQRFGDSDDPCVGAYQRSSPANFYTDNHLVAVVEDLVSRYEIDGIHLDHIRYGGSGVSCDSVSLCRYENGVEFCEDVPACVIDDDYKDFQRRQVNGTVRRVYQDVIVDNPDVWLSAAVWPIYVDYWGWGGLEGFHDYYQDSKAWVAGEYIDSISPMIYSNPGIGCVETDSNFWTRDRWGTLVVDFQGDAAGRFVVPGIGGKYCDFEDIVWRIERAREAGTAGHALFSYSGLKVQEFFDDLAEGPYAVEAVVPEAPWKMSNE